MYGYSPRGKHCFARHDWHAKGRVNALGAMISGALLTVGLTHSNVDADIFNLWLENDLMPKRPPTSVIVMDTSTFHKRSDTKVMIKKAGHTLEYFPPYFPDLNPIEHKWEQAKARRRKTRQEVEEIFKTNL